MLPYPHIGLFVFNRKKQQTTFRKSLTNISQVSLHTSRHRTLDVKDGDRIGRWF